MDIANVELILIINFLHHVGKGLFLPLVAIQIRSIGLGGDTLLGLVQALIYICQLLTTDFLALFVQGHKNELSFSFYCNFMLDALLIFIDQSLILTCVARCLAPLTAHVSITSKQYIEETEPKELLIKYCNILELVKVFGLVSGSIIGPFIFEPDDDILSVLMISACLSLACILMVQYLPSEGPAELQYSKLAELPTLCMEKLENLLGVDFGAKFNCVILQIAFVSSFIVYYTNFAYIISYNYRSTTVHIGTAMALEQLLVFLSKCLVPFFLAKYQPDKSLRVSIFTCTFSLFALYYAPTFLCHLFLYIPVFVSYVLVTYLLDDNAFNLDGKLLDDLATLNVLMNIVVPVFFGLISDIFGGYVFKCFSVLPVASSLYILNKDFMDEDARSEDR